MTSIPRTVSAAILLFSVVLLPFLVSCSQKPTREVVIYTSVDQNHAEPVLRKFTETTGIRVKPVYDVEATKTVGLANRLVAESKAARADVFWNGEIIETLRLERINVVKPCSSFGGRGRILLVNTNALQGPAPQSIFDLVSDKWPADRIAIAKPLFGTSLTHAGALYASLGREKARSFYEQLRNRNIRVVDGNSVVRDLVADGRAWIGLTDTDDADGAVRSGAPVKVVYPDQDGVGTMVIPNTVAVVCGGPHPSEAAEFVTFLLGKEAGDMMRKSGWLQVALQPSNTNAAASGIRTMRIDDPSAFLSGIDAARTDLREMFIK